MSKDLYYNLNDFFKDCDEEELIKIKKMLNKEKEFCCETGNEVNMYMQDILSKIMKFCNVNVYLDNIMVLIIRDIVQNTDVISILLDNTAHSSADIALRGIFERMLIIMYILKPNEFEYREYRACEYYFINLYERKKYFEIINDKKQKNIIEKEIEELKKYYHYKDRKKHNKFNLFDENNDYHDIKFSELARNVGCYELYKKYYAPISNGLHGKKVLDYYTYNKENSLLQQLRFPFNQIIFLKKYAEIIFKIIEVLEKWKKDIISDEVVNWKKRIMKDIKKIDSESVKVFQPKDFKLANKLKNNSNYRYMKIN